MKYKLLSSLYHQDKEKHNMVYEKRLDSYGTYLFPISVNKCQSFMVPDWEIASLIESIGRKNAAAMEVFSALPGIAKVYYMRKCLIDEIQTTNDIEGVHSTRQEITTALNADSRGKRLTRFEGMAKKYAKLFQGETLHVPLQTCKDIRNLYDEIVSNEIDAKEQPDGIIFRKSTVYVMSPTQQIRHEGVNPEEKIIEALENALHILEGEELPVLVCVAAFHYFFGYIHPFYDGNGRISRFISSYILKKNDYSLLALDFSHTIKENKKIYYKAFRICNDKKNKGDITSFIITFLELLNMAAERMYQNLKEGFEKLNRFNSIIERLHKHDKLKKKKDNLLLIFIQNSLFAVEPLKISELQEIMNCSRATIENLISMLIEEGFPIEKSRGEGRYILYHLNIEAFEEMFD